VTNVTAPSIFDRRLLALSVAVQLVLAALFGHAYDSRVFMTTGYLVATGRGPYSPLDLAGVFHHVGFNQLTTIGYPPPWPLVAGLLYRATYGLLPNIHVYQLALKLPVIAATVGLAYVVAAALRRMGIPDATCRRAWLFVLFNPLILFAGAAWGQIDVIVALLAVAALVLIWRGRWASSATLLALAVCGKPTALPVALVALVWLAGRAPREALRYAGVLLAWAAVFVAVPVAVLGWSTTQIENRPNAQFLMTGGLSYTTVARLVRDPLALPGHWWLLGMLWVIGLAAGLVVWRRGGGFDDLVRAWRA
jgi:Gpi18-like mannosyltransferase